MNLLVFGDGVNLNKFTQDISPEGERDNVLQLLRSVEDWQYEEAYELVDIIIARNRFRRILESWSQFDRKKQKLCFDSTGLVRFSSVDNELQRIFVGADPANFEEWKTNWINKGWPKNCPLPHVCDSAITLGMAVLQATLVAVSSDWAGVLFFARKTKFSHPWYSKEGFFLHGAEFDDVPYPDYRSLSQPSALAAGAPFVEFEAHTEPELLTSKQLQTRIGRLTGKEPDLKTIKEAAEGLDITLAKPRRGG